MACGSPNGGCGGDGAEQAKTRPVLATPPRMQTPFALQPMVVKNGTASTRLAAAEARMAARPATNRSTPPQLARRPDTPNPFANPMMRPVPIRAVLGVLLALGCAVKQGRADSSCTVSPSMLAPDALLVHWPKVDFPSRYYLPGQLLDDCRVLFGRTTVKLVTLNPVVASLELRASRELRRALGNRSRVFVHFSSGQNGQDLVISDSSTGELLVAASSSNKPVLGQDLEIFFERMHSTVGGRPELRSTRAQLAILNSWQSWNAGPGVEEHSLWLKTEGQEDLVMTAGDCQHVQFFGRHYHLSVVSTYTRRGGDGGVPGAGLEVVLLSPGRPATAPTAAPGAP